MQWLETTCPDFRHFATGEEGDSMTALRLHSEPAGALRCQYAHEILLFRPAFAKMLAVDLPQADNTALFQVVHTWPTPSVW